MPVWRARLMSCLLLLVSAPAFAAGFDIPAGARVDLGGGRIDAAAGDVQIAGSLVLGNGEVIGVRAFRVLAGGNAQLGGGLLRLTGDFENRGTVSAAASRVEFRDGATPEAFILGNTDFGSLSLVSASGRRYRLESGSLQTISLALELQGTGAPLQLDVTVAGNIARLSLAPGGSQSIANVGVSDVHAVGQALAPAQSNQGGRGNAAGWFGGGQGGVFADPIRVPGPSWPMLALLAAAMLAGLHRHRDGSRASLRA